MGRGPRRPALSRPPEPLRPTTSGLQPPQSTRVMAVCRRMRYRWRKWVWVPMLPPMARWLHRAKVAGATVAVAGSTAVAAWYVPMIQQPSSAEPAPLHRRPAVVAQQSQSSARTPTAVTSPAAASTALHPTTTASVGPAAVAPAAANTTAAPTTAASTTTTQPTGPVSSILSSLLQNGSLQLPSSLNLPVVTLPIVPGVNLPPVSVSVPPIPLPPLSVQLPTPSSTTPVP